MGDSPIRDMNAFIGSQHSYLNKLMYKICRFMRHSGPAAFEPAHFFGSFLCASKEMNIVYFAFRKSKKTFAWLFIKSKNPSGFRTGFYSIQQKLYSNIRADRRLPSLCQPCYRALLQAFPEVFPPAHRSHRRRK